MSSRMLIQSFLTRSSCAAGRAAAGASAHAHRWLFCARATVSFSALAFMMMGVVLAVMAAANKDGEWWSGSKGE